MIPGNANLLLLASAAAADAAGGPVKSVRFHSDDSAYLNRTPSSAGNRKTFTISFWFKISGATATQHLFFAGTAVDQNLRIRLNNNDMRVQIYNTNLDANLKILNLFRDPSAWYHLVLSVDTTASTASDRMKAYINGVEAEYNSPTYPTLDSSTLVNNTNHHYIGAQHYGSPSDFFDGYIADFYLVDGSALDCTSFGAFDDNGVWQAAAYSGTFGTNGFHLFDFANESGIGDDSSGNNNDFTANNLTALGPAATQFKVLGNVSNTGSSSATNVSSLTTLQATNVSTYDIGGTNHNHLTADFGSAGTYAIQARTYLNIGTDILVFVSNNGSSWSSISNQQDPYIFTGRYIQWVRTGQGYDNQVLTAVDAQTHTDVLFDVPTNGTQSDTGAGGEVSGNYPTWNPLSGQYQELLNGNLEAESGTISQYATIPSTIAMTSGKWYAEFQYFENVNAQDDGSTFFRFGISQTDRDFESGSDPLGTAKDFGFTGAGTLRARTNGSNSYTYTGNTVADGDILSLAFDADAGKLWVARNGTWATNSGGTGDPANGNNPDFSSLTYSGGYLFVAGPYAGAASPAQGGGRLSAKLVANWGQRSFVYSAPSGFKALNTASISTPTILDGSDHFDAKIFIGNGSSQTISGLQFAPDLVWIKNRSDANDNVLSDTVRGAQKYLISNKTDAEATSAQALTAFTSDGFSVGNNDNFNNNTDSLIAWAWNAGSTTASNTDGSVTSQVRVNQSAGFSIVSWTSSNSSQGTYDSIGHGLNASPGLVITKRRTVADSWYSAHGFDLTQFGTLNSQGAFSSAGAAWGNGITSSVIGMRIGNFVNPNETMIAYCFAPVEGFSSFGSYDGNSSTDGVFVYTGFRVKWLLIRDITNGNNSWQIQDAVREPENPSNTRLVPNSSAAEGSNAVFNVDMLSNGFKLRTSNDSHNDSSTTYIYAAFASHPFSSNGGLAR